MRNAFVTYLIEAARKDPSIFLITPDLGFGVLEPFANEFPDRFLNCGIAEQNAVGIAAGLALKGMKPYIYSIIPFAVSRPYEQIKVDIAYMNTNVKIVGVGAGFAYGPAGATHHAIDDIAIMRTLPNMTVVAPGSVNETRELTRYSAVHEGPMYIRLARRGEPDYGYGVTFGKFSSIFEGSEVCIIATSNMLERAYALVENARKNGKDYALMSAHTIKPFDRETVLNLVDRGTPIVTMESHNIYGGLASATAEVIACSGKAARFMPIAVPDKFSHVIGNQQYIEEHMGFADIPQRIESFLRSA